MGLFHVHQWQFALHPSSVLLSYVRPVIASAFSLPFGLFLTFNGWRENGFVHALHDLKIHPMHYIARFRENQTFESILQIDAPPCRHRLREKQR